MEYKIKKGLEIPISGQPNNNIDHTLTINEVAVLGSDFNGIKPSIKVKEGDTVLKGQVLFTDKKHPQLVFTAPAGGKIKAINRGERRVLLSIVIAVDSTLEAIHFPHYQPNELSTLDSANIKDVLLQSGLWASFRTRPFSHIPSPDSQPSAIFVNCMDSNPLAANPINIINDGNNPLGFSNGLTVLSRLFDSKVHVVHEKGTNIPLHEADNVEYHQFSGPHPAGLVGTHIHFIDPVSLTKIAWHLNAQDVIAIGELFTSGELFNQRIIALSGAQVKNPRLIKTIMGANLLQLTENQLVDGNNRIISGSALSGRQITDEEAYLGRYDLQVTVLKEGTELQLFGWLNPKPSNFSINRTTFSHLFKNRLFNLTTNMGGSDRSMIPLENYLRVMPLDIEATMLLRELLIGDTDAAQQLGCLELDEEDIALCTFVCPAKYNYGPLLRQALETIYNEG